MNKYTDSSTIYTQGAEMKKENEKDEEKTLSFDAALKIFYGEPTISDDEKIRINRLIKEVEETGFKERCTQIANKKEQERKKIIKLSFPMIAALVFCILLLGSVTAYAFNNSYIKEYFFGKAKEHEFRDIYIPIEKEYKIGDHKLIINGIIYDNASGTGYLSMELHDNAGIPIDIEIDKSLIDNESRNLIRRKFSGFRLNLIKISAENDNAYLFFTDAQYFATDIEGSNILINAIKWDDNEEDKNMNMQFAVFDEENWQRAYSDLEKIDISSYYKVDIDYYNKTGKFKQQKECKDFFPEIMSIIDKYAEIHTFESDTYTGRVVETDRCKVIIGRTIVMISYNINDKINVLLRKEDGTEIELVINGKSNHLFRSVGFGKGDSKTGNWIMKFSTGYIFNMNEKLAVVIDGEVFE